MLYLNTESNDKPQKVTIAQLPDGGKHIRLADNIREETRTDYGEDGAEITAKVYVYDEVAYDMEAERTETEKDIKKDFAAWWEFGSQDEEPVPTMEERLAAVEDYLMELAMGL